MSKEGVFFLLTVFFSFLIMVVVMWAIGQVLAVCLGLCMWKVLVGSSIGLALTLVIGLWVLGRD